MSTEVSIIEPNKVVPLRAGGRVAAIVPQSVEEVFRIAKAIHASGLAPNGMKSALMERSMTSVVRSLTPT